jgi:hypothetical protein
MILFRVVITVDEIANVFEDQIKQLEIGRISAPLDVPDEIIQAIQHCGIGPMFGLDNPNSFVHRSLPERRSYRPLAPNSIARLRNLEDAQDD